jgi:DNA-directed RNA polymerase subunit RPC12/RpoP
MKNQLFQMQLVPDKFPLHEVAVIVCSRCKERYQLPLVLSHMQTAEYLACPRCQSSISIHSTDHGALVPRDQGTVIGLYTIPLTPNHQTQQLSTMR